MERKRISMAFGWPDGAPKPWPFLSEHRGDASPETLVYIRVPDVEGVAKEFNVEVVEQPWAREVHLTDSDGNRLGIATPRM